MKLHVRATMTFLTCLSMLSQRSPVRVVNAWTRNATSRLRAWRTSSSTSTTMATGAFVCFAYSRSAASSSLCQPNSMVSSSLPSTNSSPPCFHPSALQEDTYNGITVHLNHERQVQMTPEDFRIVLERKLQEWRQEGRKGIWLQLPQEQADKVPIATALGFHFHAVVSSHDGTKLLVMSQWLPDSASRLPLGPSHQVGIGCLIFHPTHTNKMLVVQEKTGPAASHRLWKVPTGLTDPHEDIHEAAQRELKEETNLDGQFEGIVALRQAHRGGYRSHSDLYFLCAMRLLHEDLDVAKACPDEIAGMQWMDVHEYCDQEPWQHSPVMMEMNRAILEYVENPHALQRSTLRTFASMSGGPAVMNTVYKSSCMRNNL